MLDPNTCTPEDLRALNDPWITLYCDEIDRLESDMQTDELIHIGQSFGRPGSMTEGGQRYRAHSLELELTRMQLLLCLVFKGHVDIHEVQSLHPYNAAP